MIGNLMSSALDVTDKLFFDRPDATLDRDAAHRLTAQGLTNSDDGELFLEYRESEAISLDDGRIRSASFDTTLGFGLRAVAGEWMRRVELDPSRIDETPGSYSGGMRQRLQIARNLVTQPRLVLMDEPTSGLDVSVQARLLDLIRTLVARMNLSVLLVTHDLGVARLLAHRTLVMCQGRIVEQGDHDALLASGGLYSRLLARGEASFDDAA